MKIFNSVHQMRPGTKPAAQSKAPGYRVVAKGKDAADIYIYGIIGQDFWGDGVSAKQFATDLKGLGNAVKTINLRINSEGGDVFAGKAIYTLLQGHDAKIIVHIDGLAASAASFVAMAGDEIRIAEGAFVMIHNAWTVAMGGAEDFRRTADLLETVNSTIISVYEARTKQDPKQLKKWMDAEKWFTGPEALEHGFADKLVENVKAVASASAAVTGAIKFKNLPRKLRPNYAAALAKIASLQTA